MNQPCPQESLPKNCDDAAVTEKGDAALSFARLDPIMLIGAAVSTGKWV